LLNINKIGLTYNTSLPVKARKKLAFSLKPLKKLALS